MYNLSDFKVVSKLGEGTYGVVIKAAHVVTGELVAIKTFKNLGNDDEGIGSTTLREVSILKELKHPNIVLLHRSVYKNKQLHLIFEYSQYDLQKYMSELNGPMEKNQLMNFTYQIFQGILFCHTRSILHRDLKPSNILVDVNTTTIKIADFGLAQMCQTPSKKLTHEVITLWYRPPEILFGCKFYGTAVDVWSAGCIFAQMAVNSVLFEGDSEIDQLFKIFQIIGTPTDEDLTNIPFSNRIKQFPFWEFKLDEFVDEELSLEGYEMLKAMVQANPKNRISIKDALLHPYFNSLDKSKVPISGEEHNSCPFKKWKNFVKSN